MQYESNSTSLAWIESSPSGLDFGAVLPGNPLTPIISPLLMFSCVSWKDLFPL